MKHVVRAFGTLQQLQEWREFVKQEIGKEPTGLRDEGGKSFCEVKVTKAEGEKVMKPGLQYETRRG